jgi:mRNA interferase RelE/StbE
VPRHRLAFHPKALDEWRALDSAIRRQFKRALVRRLENPVVPAARLKGDLNHCFKIKSQSSGHRLIYTVLEDHVVVLVLAVTKREKALAYRRATTRWFSGG